MKQCCLRGPPHSVPPYRDRSSTLARMSNHPSSVGESARDASVSMRERVRRYFFYGWLFRDADCGSSLERAAALRHNRGQAKWLPVYMMRWGIGGAVLVVLEVACERVLGSPVLSAALAVALSLVVLHLLITGVCWVFLRAGG
jgi:hypothetical protein